MQEGLLRFATVAMGTRFELVLAGPDGQERMRPVGEAAIEEIQLWHRRLNRFAPDSLISRINRTASLRPVPLDARTFELIAAALAVHGKSGGVFDITVSPLMATFGLPGSGSARGGTERPNGDASDWCSGADAVLLDAQDRSIRFLRPDIALDLGGIAKGHAIDCAAALLREHGVSSAFLHGGTSSVLGMGSAPGLAGWRVAIGGDGDCGGGGDVPVMELRDNALAVARVAGRRLEGPDGEECGHVMDPRTGEPVRTRLLAAVVAPSARLADAWATALLVLGERPAAMPEDWTAVVLPDKRGTAAAEMVPEHGTRNGSHGSA